MIFPKLHRVDINQRIGPARDLRSGLLLTVVLVFRDDSILYYLFNFSLTKVNLVSMWSGDDENKKILHSEFSS